MKNENFYVVQGWMVNELNLSGNELMIYAVLYGFSQEQNSWFEGSLNYLSSCINCKSKTTVFTLLKEMVNKGLIEKQDYKVNNVQFCRYRTVYQKLIHLPVSKIDTNNINNINNMNIIYNWDENISCECETKNKMKCSRRSTYNINGKNHCNQHSKQVISKLLLKSEEKETKIFKKPTVEEIKEYCLERHNNINAEYFYDFYESKNWMIGKNKMKDWKAAVRTWERNNKQTSNQNKKTEVVPEWFNSDIVSDDSENIEDTEFKDFIEEFRK